MSKLTKLLMGAGLACALSACGQGANTAATQTPPPAPPVDQAAEAAKAQLAQQAANEKVVEDFFNMNQPPELLSPDYIQHNAVFARFAQINNLQGREAFQAMNDTFRKLRVGPPPGAANGPKPPPGNEFYKIMADGDLVTVIHERYRPDPGMKGKFYPEYTFDTFRVQDGKLAEHWGGGDANTLPDKLPIFLREPLSKIHFPKQAKSAQGG